MAPARGTPLLLLPLLLVFHGHLGSTWACSSKQECFAKSLQALQRLVDHYEHNAKDLNPDAIFGIRVAQGQLLQLRDRIPLELWRPVKKLTSQLDVIVQLGLLQQMKHPKSAQYTLLVWDQIRKPFFVHIPASYRRLRNVINNVTADASYDEKKGDRCLGELDNASSNRQRTCDLSDACMNMMTKPNVRAYAKTHQILYLASVVNAGCALSYQKWLYRTGKMPSLTEFVNEGCSGILKEASVTARHMQFLFSLQQDLFLEQLTVCGMLGYKEFTNTKWLSEILKWQSPDGCYRNDQATPRGPRRRLLYEQIGKDGCSAHKSGLAMGYLGISINVLAPRL